MIPENSCHGELVEPRQPERTKTSVRKISTSRFPFQKGLLAAIAALKILMPAAVSAGEKKAPPKAVEQLTPDEAFKVFIQNPDGTEEPFTKFPYNATAYFLVIECDPRIDISECYALTEGGDIIKESPEIVQTPMEEPGREGEIRRRRLLVFSLADVKDRKIFVSGGPLAKTVEVGHYESDADIRPALVGPKDAPAALDIVFPGVGETGFVEEFELKPAPGVPVDSTGAILSFPKPAAKPAKKPSKKPGKKVAAAKSPETLHGSEHVDTAPPLPNREYFGMVGFGLPVAGQGQGAPKGTLEAGVMFLPDRASKDHVRFGFGGTLGYAQPHINLADAALVRPLRESVPQDIAEVGAHGIVYVPLAESKVAVPYATASIGPGLEWLRTRGASDAALNRADPTQLLNLEGTSQIIGGIRGRVGVALDVMQALRVSLGIEASVGLAPVESEAGSQATVNPFQLAPSVQIGGVFFK